MRRGKEADWRRLCLLIEINVGCCGSILTLYSAAFGGQKD